MNKQELSRLLNSGENTTIEYKEAKNAMPSSLFETVASFLNKEGGTILLGVSDDGSEGKIYPALRLEDFREDLFEKARRFIRSKRTDHPWLEEDYQGILRLSNFYRKDFSTGEEGYTLAAALMFGKDETIQSILPAYKIEALVRKENLDRWDDRLTLRTNLIESYQLLMDFIRKHLPDKFYLDGDRRLDLRELIFREIVANIIIHREYTNPLSTELIIFKDKIETTNPNKPHLRGPLTLESFSPFPKNPLLRKFFSEMGWADEVGSGIKNVSKYLKYYTSDIAEPLFWEDDVFRTSVPLVIYTFSQKIDYLFELLGVDKNSIDHKLLETIQSFEISSPIAFWEEKNRFLYNLVSSWLKSSTGIAGLKSCDIKPFENPDFFEVPSSPENVPSSPENVPSLHEKSTNLLGKRFMTIMKIFIGTGLPISMEQLMKFMNYKNRKSFNELYMHPLIQNEFIKRTIPGKLKDPNQMYMITKKGRLFLGGFDI